MTDEVEARPEHHKAKVVLISGVSPIEGADKIERVHVKGLEDFSFVSQKGQFVAFDKWELDSLESGMAVFIPPDSIVPQTEPFKFIWGQYITKTFEISENGAIVDQTVSDAKRRITVRRYKGVWSEGLLLPTNDFTHYGNMYYKEGADVTDVIGIRHYDPDEEILGGQGVKRGSDKAWRPVKKRNPRTIKGWLKFIWYKLTNNTSMRFTAEVPVPKYDVNNLKNYSFPFEEGEVVQVTEKIHGSNARYVYLEGVFYTGSKSVWQDPDGTDYSAKAAKANPWIKEWCKINPGYALYGEVTPRQRGFDYGSKEPKFFLFDIRTPEGEFISKDDVAYYTIPLTADFVPTLYIGKWNKEAISKFVDGSSEVPGAKHVREGIVINSLKERRIGQRRAQYKWVSNAFLEKDKKLTDKA